MRIFRFDREVGKEIQQFGSLNVVMSKILRLEGDAVINSAFIQAGGKIGYHQAVNPQLFLLVQGTGWVRAGSDQIATVRAGQAVFWEQGEWHESGSETGMTAVIIEGTHLDPSEWMPVLKRYEP